MVLITEGKEMNLTKEGTMIEEKREVVITEVREDILQIGKVMTLITETEVEAEEKGELMIEDTLPVIDPMEVDIVKAVGKMKETTAVSMKEVVITRNIIQEEDLPNPLSNTEEMINQATKEETIIVKEISKEEMTIAREISKEEMTIEEVTFREEMITEVSTKEEITHLETIMIEVSEAVIEAATEVAAEIVEGSVGVIEAEIVADFAEMTEAIEADSGVAVVASEEVEAAALETSKMKSLNTVSSTKRR